MRLISAGSLVRAQSGPLFRAISQVRCLPWVTNTVSHGSENGFAHFRPGAPTTRAGHGHCPSGPVLSVISLWVVHHPFSARDIICRAPPQEGDAQVRNRQRSQNHRLDREKTRKRLSCTLPSNLRSIRAAWRPRSSRLRSRRASRACRHGSRPSPSPGVARSRSSTSRCCRNPPCR
jgi:hypothetical protein